MVLLLVLVWVWFGGIVMSFSAEETILVLLRENNIINNSDLVVGFVELK